MKKCAYCGKEFVNYFKRCDLKYCSKKCKYAQYNKNKKEKADAKNNSRNR
jgi:hypothetical protein